MQKTDFAVIGAGIAGCECAMALARQGHTVTVFERKPADMSEAHVSDNFSELVCSNSLRSAELTSGVGLLKAEMRALGSSFMAAADACAIPAGKALAVDRQAFSRIITLNLYAHPRIQIVSRRIDSLADDALLAVSPRATIIAAGPLASPSLASAIGNLAGQAHCYFYDAIAPIVWTDTLNMNKVFRASRYGGDTDDTPGDYLNCPFTREEYERFNNALLAGEIFRPEHEDMAKHFEACMPIEALAARGPRTLTFGPLKPVGLIDPRTGQRPWAVLQLRAEQSNLETCNLVGCQTKLLQKEQQRIFRLVPGLEQVEFARYGSMHRNTYINAPLVLAHDFSLKARRDVFLAGQITGVEGYVESAASGLWTAMQLGAAASGRSLPVPPPETALGALLGHLQRPCKNFQPSNIHFGLMPPLAEKTKKKDRKSIYAQRAREAFSMWLKQNVAPYFNAGPLAP